jgi:hypothetical protein
MQRIGHIQIVLKNNSNIVKHFLAYTMSCPCGLTEEVLEVAKNHGVPLIGGKCQNPLANGSDGICGKALGAHSSSQSNFNSYFMKQAYFNDTIK